MLSKSLLLSTCLSLALQCSALTPSATGLSYVVPPPAADGGMAWKAANLRAQGLVAQMTLQEKVDLVTGQEGLCAGQTGNVTRLGIPTMCFQDGPAGPRPGSIQFPSGVTTAATWDVDLIYARSLAIGKEFYDLGIHVAMAIITGGPLGRSPKGGRNWEGWYADPYGTGIASWHGVRGLRDSGVQVLAKHYIGYEQETFSIYAASEQVPISSNIDDKTTHEIYLWSFAEAIRAGVTHIMCGYNSVNGTHSCANSESNNKMLKTELNFQGALISDWGATWGTQAFVEGGLDANMPGLGFGGILGPFYDKDLYKMVQNGTIKKTRLDDMVTRMIVPLIVTGQIDKPLPSTVTTIPGMINRPLTISAEVDGQKLSAVEIARKISADGTVLLKNTGSLPLRSPRIIAIIGQDAGPNPLGIQGCGKLYRDCGILQNNGTLSLGGGSGYTWANNLITPLDAIQAKARETNAFLQYVIDNTAESLIYDTLAGGGLSVSPPDVCLVFADRYQRENMDRNDLNLNIGNWTRSEDIILETAANCNNTIVVLHVGGPVIMEAWIDNPNVTAVLAPLYPGEQTGPGLVDILWGHVSPNAKLPFTVGKSESDYPPNTISQEHSITPQADFTEKLKIDYRWFDTYNITPRFEFGFGLSYTAFKYSNIDIDLKESSDKYAIQTTNEEFVGQTAGQSIYDVIATVTADITNTGKHTGSEVAQLYVEFPANEEEPPKLLRGFTKIKNMEPGHRRKASFPVRRKDVMIWDVTEQKWRFPKDESVKFYVGASSRNLALEITHSLKP
ncbi:Glycoside hydrolase family 3 [Penicillium samsonianum]|uniref:Glycoside hydrolase family 3 n=1 Tax=Penicillium samsonianum TaxID=1882272 RepID=UPI00254869E2|nr:Glycoside hydrolase family 3 [Penicillium samsonianum]KAJ6133532.1 Glycoside hydrolase family 3 [Penicillium samsonianum]